MRRKNIKKKRKIRGLLRRDERMFLSDTARRQYSAVKNISLAMRIVLLSVVMIASVSGIYLVFNLLIPWMATGSQQDFAESSEDVMLEFIDDTLKYDDMGLPVYTDDINLFVINPSNPVGKNFSPDVRSVENIKVDGRIADALRMLVRDAKEDGLVIEFESGYISYEEQEQIFNNTINDLINAGNITKVMAQVEASEISARAGESDAQTGLCVTLRVVNVEDFEESQTFRWLNNNAGKYGFIFRYPNGKEQHTKRDADLRILRYVGGDNAEKMRQLSMCLEEYISYLGRQ